MRYYVFFIITILLLSTINFTTFGQVTAPQSTEPKPTEPNITTQTDKTSYVNGDTIVISGGVKSFVEGTPLTIQILDPDKNLVQIAQIDVAKDGKYTTTIKATGALWKKSGTYTLKVQYGLPNVVAETNFDFKTATTPISKIFEVKAGNRGTFDVKYTIDSGTIKDITIDYEGLALVVSVNATSDGIVSLEIPRALMDAKTASGDDDAFIILIDGAEVKPQKEEKNTESRTLTIQFLQGDSDIEIIGTQIIPEFGAIAALVLAIAIISIIAVSAKTRLRLMPKY